MPESDSGENKKIGKNKEGIKRGQREGQREGQRWYSDVQDANEMRMKFNAK